MQSVEPLAGSCCFIFECIKAYIIFIDRLDRQATVTIGFDSGKTIDIVCLCEPANVMATMAQQLLSRPTK